MMMMMIHDDDEDYQAKNNDKEDDANDPLEFFQHLYLFSLTNIFLKALW